MDIVSTIGWFDEEHSLMRPDRSFTKLKDIKVGDEVVAANGSIKKVVDVERIQAPNHYQLTIDDKFLNCAFESKILTKKENESMKFLIIGHLLLTDNIINFTDQNKFIKGETMIDPTFTVKNIQAIDFINKPINLVKITIKNDPAYINLAYVIHI